MTETLIPQHPAEALLLAKISPDLQQRLRQLRLMVFDVDGVLTDGRLWYGEQGEAVKAFTPLTVMGCAYLMKAAYVLP